jgi:hypothetical protein
MADGGGVCSLVELVGIRLHTKELGEKLALFRTGVGSGGFGLFFGAKGLNAVEVAGDLANGALQAVDHAADTIEDGGFLFEGIEAGIPEFGFGVAEAIETPGIGGELFDELMLDGVMGMPGVFELCDESCEFLGIFAGNDERFGMDAVFDGVQANGGFSFRRGRPGGKERIGAIGGYLCW